MWYLRVGPHRKNDNHRPISPVSPVPDKPKRRPKRHEAAPRHMETVNNEILEKTKLKWTAEEKQIILQRLLHRDDSIPFESTSIANPKAPFRKVSPERRNPTSHLLPKRVNQTHETSRIYASSTYEFFCPTAKKARRKGIGSLGQRRSPSPTNSSVTSSRHASSKQLHSPSVISEASSTGRARTALPGRRRQAKPNSSSTRIRHRRASGADMSPQPHPTTVSNRPATSASQPTEMSGERPGTCVGERQQAMGVSEGESDRNVDGAPEAGCVKTKPTSSLRDEDLFPMPQRSDDEMSNGYSSIFTSSGEGSSDSDSDSGNDNDSPGGDHQPGIAEYPTSRDGKGPIHGILNVKKKSTRDKASRVRISEVAEDIPIITEGWGQVHIPQEVDPVPALSDDESYEDSYESESDEGEDGGGGDVGGDEAGAGRPVSAPHTVRGAGSGGQHSPESDQAHKREVGGPSGRRLLRPATTEASTRRGRKQSSRHQFSNGYDPHYYNLSVQKRRTNRRKLASSPPPRSGSPSYDNARARSPSGADVTARSTTSQMSAISASAASTKSAYEGGIRPITPTLTPDVDKGTNTSGTKGEFSGWRQHWEIGSITEKEDDRSMITSPVTDAEVMIIAAQVEATYMEVASEMGEGSSIKSHPLTLPASSMVLSPTEQKVKGQGYRPKSSGGPGSESAVRWWERQVDMTSRPPSSNDPLGPPYLSSSHRWIGVGERVQQKLRQNQVKLKKLGGRNSPTREWR